MVHIAKVMRVANLGRWAARPLVTAINTIEWMSRVATQRSALRLLDDRQLKDLGLSRADALREASRPFWDVPPRSLVEGADVGRRTSRAYRSQPGNHAGAQIPQAGLPSR